jgi:polysaccharide biosynthesis transport protein
VQHDGHHHVSALSDYLRVLRRRKWIVLLVSLLVPLVAVSLSMRQKPIYQASAEVLLNQQNLAATLAGVNDPNVYQDPARFAETQVALARVPRVVQRVEKATGIETDLLSRSTVGVKENSNILEFVVTHGDPAVAARLATEYARQFTVYRYDLDTAALERARREVTQRMSEVETVSGRDSALYKDLAEKEQQLRTMEALQTSNASLVRAADRAVRVAPRPVRNGILASGLGLVFAVALAFLWETLDTRVRSGEEIGERLGLPLLARLPEPPRRLQRANRLVMLEEPTSFQAEAFRMLRTNLEFVNLERRRSPLPKLPKARDGRDRGSRPVALELGGESGTRDSLPAPSSSAVPAPADDPLERAQSIMITSAVEKEGKSTTVANLAVALARAGRDVTLVDLDLRRPFLDRFFGLDGRPGVTDVALGRVALEDALTKVAIVGHADGGTGAGSDRNGRARLEVEGTLRVLTSGPVPPDAGEFVGTRVLADILGELRQVGDFVLIDAPPLLQVGDAMTLSANVDALIVVTRLQVVRRPMLTELHRVLDASPAEKLGFVLAAADLEKGEGYGYGYGYGYGQYARAGDPASGVAPVRR